MIRCIFLYFFILIGFPAIGQNLVPNGSFEDYIVCPTNYSQQNATYWEDFGTSDYFNACNNSINGIVGVPVNVGGFQVPYHGNAYAGIIGHSLATNSREFLQIKLLGKLDSNKTYCVRFFVNLSDSSFWATDSIGAYFSDTIFNLGTVVILPTPQILVTNYITDKENWTLVEGQLIASGNEELLTIGNFSSYFGADYLPVPGGCTFDWVNNYNCVASYYYIDSVSVTLCPDPASPSPPTESNITIPNVFTPNGDGINDVFTIETTAIESMSCEIFNRWGIKVATLSQLNEGWDGRTISGQEATEGVYYYVVTAKGTDNNEHRKTGFIQLLR